MKKRALLFTVITLLYLSPLIVLIEVAQLDHDKTLCTWNTTHIKTDNDNLRFSKNTLPQSTIRQMLRNMFSAADLETESRTIRKHSAKQVLYDRRVEMCIKVIIMTKREAVCHRYFN